MEAKLCFWKKAGKVHKIGVYDSEAGNKPRPGVVHLLNRGSLSIVCLFVLYSLTQIQS